MEGAPGRFSSDPEARLADALRDIAPTPAPRTLLSDHPPVNGKQFIDRVAALGRARDIPVRVHPKRGNGSHVTVYYGDRKTVVKDRRKHIGPGLLAAMGAATRPRPRRSSLNTEDIPCNSSMPPP